MASLNIFLKEITDTYIRENFYRLLQYFQAQPILNANFTFFEVDIPLATTKTFPHNLGFIPRDVLVLSVVGDNRFYFRYQEFTKVNFSITTLGPVRLRFLAGNYPTSQVKANAIDYPFVNPTP